MSRNSLTSHGSASVPSLGSNLSDAIGIVAAAMSASANISPGIFSVSSAGSTTQTIRVRVPAFIERLGLPPGTYDCIMKPATSPREDDAYLVAAENLSARNSSLSFGSSFMPIDPTPLSVPATTFISVPGAKVRKGPGGIPSMHRSEAREGASASSAVVQGTLSPTPEKIDLSEAVREAGYKGKQLATDVSSLYMEEMTDVEDRIYSDVNYSSAYSSTGRIRPPEGYTLSDADLVRIRGNFYPRIKKLGRNTRGYKAGLYALCTPVDSRTPLVLRKLIVGDVEVPNKRVKHN